MRKISDTIARLAALKAQQATLGAQACPDRLAALPDFGSNPGALAAKCYIPDNLPDGAPLVVVLHGCMQTAAAYDHHSGWSKLADAAGFALLYPEQRRANNPSTCFNWFKPADTRRDSGEALSIRQMVETMIVAHGLDRKRVFVTGLSAGGAMAGTMLAVYPDVFAGGAIFAGVPHGSATTIPQAFDRMRGHGGPSEALLQKAIRAASRHRGPWPRIAVWHGNADRTVAFSNAQDVVAQWRGVHGVHVKADRVETDGPLTREVWNDDKGKPAIELNVIADMGHGTPLGPDGLSTPGPYMLDVGISSTRDTARFWGIDKAAEKGGKARPAKASRTAAPEPRPSRTPSIAPVTREKAKPSAQARPAGRKSPGAAATGVRKIIEDALRAAGLMR